MKLWIPMLILAFSVAGLCLWDTVFTKNVFNHLETHSNLIYNSLKSSTILNEEIQNEIISLNAYWTKKMDTLCISISRKDLQPISDYLQYLYSSIKNQNQEDAITYSRLLNYNILGLKECVGISLVNLL